MLAIERESRNVPLVSPEFNRPNRSRNEWRWIDRRDDSSCRSPARRGHRGDHADPADSFPSPAARSTCRPRRRADRDARARHRDRHDTSLPRPRRPPHRQPSTTTPANYEAARPLLEQLEASSGKADGPSLYRLYFVRLRGRVATRSDGGNAPGKALEKLEAELKFKDARPSLESAFYLANGVRQLGQAERIASRISHLGDRPGRERASGSETDGGRPTSSASGKLYQDLERTEAAETLVPFARSKRPRSRRTPARRPTLRWAPSLPGGAGPRERGDDAALLECTRSRCSKILR